MGNFKKSVAVNGKYKSMVIRNNEFVDPETGNVVDVIAELSKIYGEEEFSISTSAKTDIDLD